MRQSKNTSSDTPEWGFTIEADEISETPRSYFLSPTEQEIKDLERRLDVKSIDRLEATLNVSRQAGGRIYVQGHMKAKITQSCVVTLEPVEDWIEDDFDAWYLDKDSTVSFTEAKKNHQTKKGHVEVEVSEESDDPEPLVDGKIQGGELVTQYLSLAINPYPHKEGAAHEFRDDEIEVNKPSELRKNPFEALKDWKSKR